RQLTSDLRFGLNRRTRRVRQPGRAYPSVSIVFAAHNEQAVVAQKMSNCARVNYPADLLEVLVGCDGCTDATAALARASPMRNMTVLGFRDRRGKPAVLNDLLALAHGEIVVFCDANTDIEPDALQALVRHFARPEIGCVCGELRLRAKANSPNGEQ